MTLTLDNTVGGANANAYCSIAEADAYHEARGFNDRWVTGSVTEKTAAIVWATRLLDMENFVGTMTVRTGALRWPRFGITDRDYRIVDPQVIPQFIKNAVAEWAFFLLSEDRTADEGGLVQYGGKVGPITDPAYFTRKTMPSSVADILRPYLAGAYFGSGVGHVRRG